LRFRLEPNLSPRKTTNRRSKSVMSEKRTKNIASIKKNIVGEKTKLKIFSVIAV
jgi:hypothetical protein